MRRPGPRNTKEGEHTTTTPPPPGPVHLVLRTEYGYYLCNPSPVQPAVYKCDCPVAVQWLKGAFPSAVSGNPATSRDHLAPIEPLVLLNLD